MWRKKIKTEFTQKTCKVKTHFGNKDRSEFQA